MRTCKGLVWWIAVGQFMLCDLNDATHEADGFHDAGRICVVLQGYDELGHEWMCVLCGYSAAEMAGDATGCCSRYMSLRRMPMRWTME